MTDPFSARRAQRRAGRHRGDSARPPRATASGDEARANRDKAFGMRRRAWITAANESTPTTTGPDAEPAAASEPPTETPAPSEADTAPETGAAPETGSAPGTTDVTPPVTASTPRPRPRGRRARRETPPPEQTGVHDAWSDIDAAPSTAAGASGISASTPAAASSPSAAPAVSEPEDSTQDQQTPDAPLPAKSAPQASTRNAAGAAPSSRRSKAPLLKRSTSRTPTAHSGSLPVVAGWTALTTVVPGSGLLTTPLRRAGWVLLAVMGALTLTLLGFILFTDPIRSGIMLATSRAVLIALMIGVLIMGLVWCAQILATGMAQSTRHRLRGGKRTAALVLAAILAAGAALPFGRGVQSLWAAQGLLGSDTVFSGTDGNTRTVAGKDPWKGVGRINIMLLGQDAGADRTGTRPDTIMVASIDTATGRTALFSIPRNLEHVRFPKGTVAAKRFPKGFRYYGKDQDLINAVWSWAEDEKNLFPSTVKEPGLTATQWAVEETLGLPIDYYAMVNLQGFSDLVDAIGGVDMEVERRIPIGGGTNQATGGKYKITGWIEPGQQRLDGYHALWYARSREGSDDFNRMCRQQRIVRVVAEEANPQRLALSIPGLVSATEKNIETSIPQSDIDAFVDLGLRIKDAGFTSYPITPQVTKPWKADWPYLKKWVQASIDESMKQAGPTSVAGKHDTAATPKPTAPSPGGKASGKPSTTPSKSPSATPSETPSETATPSEGTSPTESSKKPEVEKDPLRSCLPGYSEEQDG